MTESVNDRIAKATGCRFATVSRSLLATGATPRSVLPLRFDFRRTLGRREGPRMVDANRNNGPRTDRDENGRFRRGNSGRPKGARHKATWRR